MTPERKRALRNERNFFIPILRMLQDNGGELEDISQIGRLIPSYSDITEDEVNYFEITKKGTDMSHTGLGEISLSRTFK